MIGLGLGLLAAGGSFPACHRKDQEKAAAEAAAVKKSFDDLKGSMTSTEVQFTDLRKKVEALPTDLPHYQETRETFFATEEGRGVMDAKLTLLSGRLDAAMASKNPQELDDLSKEIATTSNSVGQIQQIYVTLLHQTMALERMAEKREQSKEAADKAAAAEAEKPAPKHKGGKAKPSKP